MRNANSLIFATALLFANGCDPLGRTDDLPPRTMTSNQPTGSVTAPDTVVLKEVNSQSARPSSEEKTGSEPAKKPGALQEQSAAAHASVDTKNGPKRDNAAPTPSGVVFKEDSNAEVAEPGPASAKMRVPVSRLRMR